ncbi:MAG: hypothetical protein WA825_03845 [Steroidobacteraceae bacterium]
MLSNCRIALMSGLLVVLAALGGCTGTRAPKVQCESNLRPINPANLERPQP